MCQAELDIEWKLILVGDYSWKFNLTLFIDVLWLVVCDKSVEILNISRNFAISSV